MSDQPAPSASAPQPPADRPAAEPPRSAKPPQASAPPKPPKSPKPRRGGALAVLALLLSLLALAAVAFGGWQWWQHRQDAGVGVAHLQKQVDDLRQMLATAKQQDAERMQARQAMQSANQALQQQVAGLSARIGSLDAAVAALARHQRDGREAMLLDQAGMLLRMGQQRYTLFHDGKDAIKALDLADQTLVAVHDTALAGVRHTIAAERKALADTQPASRAADLATLADLRANIASLPLKPLENTAKSTQRGFWSRVWHALSTAVVIRRDDGSVQSLADARLTRQLAALNVAEAQAARLAWDGAASHAALERVAEALDTAFDADDAGVRKARADVARLLAEKPASSPAHLGKALKQLEDLRDVRGAADPATPATPTSTPAPAPAPAGTSA